MHRISIQSTYLIHCCKFADDTYLIVAGRHASTRVTEIEHVQIWAAANNLCLNHTKSAEIIFTKSRLNTNIQFSLPQPILGIPQVNSIKILGVTICDINCQSPITSEPSLDNVRNHCMPKKNLRAHGLNNRSIQTIFNSIIMSKLLYASPAWSGFANKEDQQRIASFLRKSSKSAFAPPDLLSFSQLSADIDDKLFKKMSSDGDHVLHNLLAPVCDTEHNLRRRNHPFVLPAKAKTALQEKNFLNRVLYKNSY